jgi:hypothetical protein
MKEEIELTTKNVLELLERIQKSLQYRLDEKDMKMIEAMIKKRRKKLNLQDPYEIELPPNIKSPPSGFEMDLSPFGSQLYDSYCGEPTHWGFKILTHLGEERWGQLCHKVIKMECSYPNWYAITKILSRSEAIKKYGEVTDEEFGPRGGWRSVTFGGKTRFLSRVVK